ncbi:MAG: hypothetical protein HFI63_11375 [Lachnospiraceae bacterium]|nr:hypothetical protein [Lachnospiraceae bacterium]
MHVVIINGSPRVQKYSNTEKIIASFARGLSEKGASSEIYAISNRKSWENIRDAYIKNEEILIALPLYVECIPGLLLEFLETLPKKNEHTRVSFLLQSGFAEGCQLRCGEEFLTKLPGYLGVRYGGCLVKGNNFGIRLLNEEKQEQSTKPYQAMGALFAEGDGFFRKEAKKFTGPEYFPLPARLIMQFVFKTFAKKMFQKAAASWGCTEPLDKKIWEANSDLSGR